MARPFFAVTNWVCGKSKRRDPVVKESLCSCCADKQSPQRERALFMLRSVAVVEVTVCTSVGSMYYSSMEFL
jgi:hypothetical protein